MKAWFWLFVITGTYCWALAQEQNPFWAAGVDTAGKAVVQTNAEGVALIETPEFPAGLRFVVRDTVGDPLAGIRVDFQGDRDSVIVARLSDVTERLSEKVVWGKCVDGELPLEMSMERERTGEGVGEFVMVFDFDYIPQFEEIGEPRFLQVKDIIDFTRNASVEEQSKWLILVEARNIEINVNYYEGGAFIGDDLWGLLRIADIKRDIDSGRWGGGMGFEVDEGQSLDFLSIESWAENANQLRPFLEEYIEQNKPRGWEEIDRYSLLKVGLVDMGTRFPDSYRALNLSTYLTGQDLRGVDFHGVNLRGLNLRQANLTKADLSGMDIEGVDFIAAHLREADFSNSNLQEADFRGADLSYANFDSVDLSGVNLDNAKLMGVDLSGRDLREVRLAGANLAEADLSGTDLSEVNLGGARLERADLTDSRLTSAYLASARLQGAIVEGADFSEANLEDAIWVDGSECLRGSQGKCVTVDHVKSLFLRGEADACVECEFLAADLVEADFRSADLHQADLSGLDLRQVDLQGADLGQADLSSANLSGLDLRTVNLQSAFLVGANLANTNLEGVNLSYANLSGADLRSTSLVEANLAYARLKDAHIEGTDFSGANLINARWITNESCLENSVGRCIT